MEQSEGILASLPEDTTLTIASCLQVGDLCAVGSCSRFWRDLCGSDFLWESLTRRRWPSLYVVTESSSVDRGDSSSLKRWKRFYMKWHTEMAERAMSVVRQLEQRSFSDLLENRDDGEAIELLDSRRLGFKDVEMFLFRPELDVLPNLVGLHYCMHWLEVPTEQLMEALQNSKISQRQVCAKWWKLCSVFYGFRMQDESHSHSVSLQDLVVPPGGEVLGAFHRRDIRAVLVAKFHSSCTSRSFPERASL